MEDQEKQRIKLLKEKHGSLYKYISEDGKYCILKSPDLQTLDACRAIAGKSSLKFDIALVENCWVEGDDVFKNNDDYRLGLFDWLGLIIRKIEGTMAEL